MYTIALTGGIGSGKSIVTETFRELNIDIFDADVVARELVVLASPCLNKIIDHFGAQILLKDGNLNRKKLRQIIFFADKERAWLDALMHPLINKTLGTNISHATSPYALLVHPLFTGKTDFPYVDRILVVDCPEKTQLSRIMKRDSISENEALAMIHAQSPRAERLRLADDILINDDDIDALQDPITLLHKSYLDYASSKPTH